MVSKKEGKEEGAEIKAEKNAHDRVYKHYLSDNIKTLESVSDQNYKAWRDFQKQNEKLMAEVFHKLVDLERLRNGMPMLFHKDREDKGNKNWIDLDYNPHRQAVPADKTEEGCRSYAVHDAINTKSAAEREIKYGLVCPKCNGQSVSRSDEHDEHLRKVISYYKCKDCGFCEESSQSNLPELDNNVLRNGIFLQHWYGNYIKD